MIKLVSRSQTLKQKADLAPRDYDKTAMARRIRGYFSFSVASYHATIDKCTNLLMIIVSHRPPAWIFFDSTIILFAHTVY